MSSNPKTCSAAKAPGARRAARFALVTGLALTAASCGTRQQAPAPRPVTILPSAAAALTPAVYMALVSDISLFAVRASEIAAERSSDPGLRSTARSVAQSQGGVGSQLSYAGRRIDLIPDAALSAPIAADLERLRTSADVEGDYRRLVGTALARALEAHEVFARSGSSPTLRPVASMAAPATRRDLNAVRGR